jgi:hypothetical protein
VSDSNGLAPSTNDSSGLSAANTTSRVARSPVLVTGNNTTKDIQRLETALVLLMRRFEILEVSLEAASMLRRGLGPFAHIQDGEEDCG